VIEGFVTVRNVGTLKTCLQLYECRRADGTLGANLRTCNKPQAEDIVLCDNGLQAKGPIVVSRVQLDGDRTQFDEKEKEEKRFWLTKPIVDPKRPRDLELSDEMRPQATDKFEFLATVPG